MKLSIGFSPCPNDTFIFDAMVNGKIDTRGIEFDVHMEDVETLNQWAAEGRLDITKLSYNAFLHTIDKYYLLHSGSALGQGVGPLVITLPSAQDKWLTEEGRRNMKLAIPGKNTTANLLLSIAFPEVVNKEEVLFSEIEQAVLDGKYDAGLVIHESRFTYEKRGLAKLEDLGDWWEQHMKAAIPLGGIVAKRSLGAEVAATVDRIIRESVEYAWKHYPSLPQFVTANAQEMEEDVMRQHINLYVNEYTTDLGETGRAAIEKLFDHAQKAGLIASGNMQHSIFY